MFSEIILNTVLFPFVFGIAFFALAYKSPKFDLWAALAAGTVLFSIYILLEGWPSLPPISSKPKVAVLIAGFTIVNAAAVFLRVNRFVLVVSLSSLALIWIGWNRIGDIAMLPRFAALLVPVLIGGWSLHNFDQQDQSGLFWPITLIAFAVGGAVLALLGAYIGLAQVLGAFAAFLGGFSLFAYLGTLFRPEMKQIILPQGVFQIIFLSLMTVLVAIGLYAPEISPTAIAVLALGLLLPGIAGRFTQFPIAAQPLLYGIVTAIPMGTAIAIAAL